MKLNFDPQLWRAFYLSAVCLEVCDEQSDQASDWWRRIIARYNPNAALLGTPGWAPFGGMLDPC